MDKEYDGLISVEYGTFYLINFPFVTVDDPRAYVRREGERHWSTTSGVGFRSGYSDHRAAVHIIWNTTRPPAIDQHPRQTESFIISSPQLALMTTLGHPEFTFPSHHTGRVSVSIQSEGTEEIIRKVQQAPFLSVEGEERWVVNIWPDQD
ncbi:hypothetical protein [Kibdelosporangium persicum]|uniref:hypothetical protein n=1 Tax=Kibdelosporangium persicum TaxID=2698649 RepID=UPI0015634A2F|nr:hypothetical protein [Kibdelosporangium persicum]